VEASARSDGDPYDWDGLGLWSAGMDPRRVSVCAVDAINGVTVAARPPTGTPYRRSARAGIDDASQARNGDLGHADAGIVDDER
jgi:hypothetical protein